MNFNNTKWISPTQLIEGCGGVNKFQRPSRRGLAEDVNEPGEEARGKQGPHPLTARILKKGGSRRDIPRPSRRQGIRRLDLPDRVRHLEFGQPRFNLKKKGVWVSIW